MIAVNFMERVSHDTLLEIFYFLKLEEVLKMATVCKAFQKIADDNRLWLYLAANLHLPSDWHLKPSIKQYAVKYRLGDFQLHEDLWQWLLQRTYAAPHHEVDITIAGEYSFRFLNFFQGATNVTHKFVNERIIQITALSKAKISEISRQDLDKAGRVFMFTIDMATDTDWNQLTAKATAETWETLSEKTKIIIIGVEAKVGGSVIVGPQIDTFVEKYPRCIYVQSTPLPRDVHYCFALAVSQVIPRTKRSTTSPSASSPATLPSATSTTNSASTSNPTSPTSPTKNGKREKKNRKCKVS
eukprot:TRINITY_DN822_c0_g1_i1.p1 TRINITY_DN822_c0_g1~~TRINITY_DN822_c0_g1_i1.p1  ORF type:complete len:299 (-),score=82.71 TRINITY_DN822_c0_g1_i1:39-935(-)